MSQQQQDGDEVRLILSALLTGIQPKLPLALRPQPYANHRSAGVEPNESRIY